MSFADSVNGIIAGYLKELNKLIKELEEVDAVSRSIEKEYDAFYNSELGQKVQKLLEDYDRAVSNLEDYNQRKTNLEQEVKIMNQRIERCSDRDERKKLIIAKSQLLVPWQDQTEFQALNSAFNRVKERKLSLRKWAPSYVLLEEKASRNNLRKKEIEIKLERTKNLLSIEILKKRAVFNARTFEQYTADPKSDIEALYLELTRKGLITFDEEKYQNTLVVEKAKFALESSSNGIDFPKKALLPNPKSSSYDHQMAVLKSSLRTPEFEKVLQIMSQ